MKLITHEIIDNRKIFIQTNTITTCNAKCSMLVIKLEEGEFNKFIENIVNNRL